MEVGTPIDWERPSHAEIRMAIRDLGPNGFDEVRAALTGGCEPFEDQMDRRMKTRHPKHRPAYKTLKRAGSRKVRVNLAAADHQGLNRSRSRHNKHRRQLAGTH